MLRRLCLIGLIVIGIGASADEKENMSNVMSEATAEHYKWGGNNDGWHYLKRDDLSIIKERMVPGGQEKPHFHEKARQFFFVIEGVLTMKTPERDYELVSGSGLEIAPGLIHQAVNATDKDVVFTVTSFPPSHGDRVNVED